jgi:hypothetical protein
MQAMIQLSLSGQMEIRRLRNLMAHKYIGQLPAPCSCVCACTLPGAPKKNGKELPLSRFGTSSAF